MIDLEEHMEARLYESKTSPTDYAKDYAANHSVMQCPRMKEIPVGTTLYNPEAEDDTGKRKAYKRYPWIKYWQAFTKNDSNKLRCTCCGNEIFVDTSVHDCKMFFNTYYKPEKGGSIDVLQAMGGHFYKNLKDSTNGYMIAPLCRSCNKLDSETPLKVVYPNKFVEEFADIID